MSIQSLSTVDTIYSADAIEFSPFNPLLFACGTYQIEKEVVEEEVVSNLKQLKIEDEGLESTGDSEGESEEEEEEEEEEEVVAVVPIVTRYGRCLIYKIDSDGTNLREHQRFDGPAILDMKWSSKKCNDKTVLAIADAKGTVQLHSMNDETELLEPLQNITCADDKTLCLSLDWSNRRIATNNPSIVVSLSNGSISTLGGESALQITSTWHAHDFEPWIAAFDCWEPNTIWTGGDDCKLKGWDLRQGCDEPIFVNKRFDGGVTTIQSHPTLENIFAVGSYDAKIRIFDRRKPLRPLLEYDIGGGIWRLKWHLYLPNRLLVAAMHGGFRVVDFEGLSENSTDLSASVHAEFDEHDSLAYGVDWNGAKKGEKDLVASCSFYDHTVHVWSC